MELYLFDLDGTTSDSAEPVLEISNYVRLFHGLKPVTWLEFTDRADMSSFSAFAESLDIPPEYADTVKELYHAKRDTIPHPGLTTCALDAITRVELTKGRNSVKLLTHESEENVLRRTENDPIDLDGRVINSRDDKANRILELHEEYGGPIIYTGDTVCDGIAVDKARARGADAYFVAASTRIAHNSPRRLRAHVATRDHTRIISSLSELERIYDSILNSSDSESFKTG